MNGAEDVSYENGERKVSLVKSKWVLGSILWLITNWAIFANSRIKKIIIKVIIQFFHKLAVFWVKKANFFSDFLAKIFLKLKHWPQMPGPELKSLTYVCWGIHLIQTSYVMSGLASSGTEFCFQNRTLGPILWISFGCT
jgi:hypothetical protein